MPIGNIGTINRSVPSSEPRTYAQLLEEKVLELEALVHSWRSWAQFVYLGGGPLEGTDQELQRRVNELHDAEVQELKSGYNLHEQAIGQLLRDIVLDHSSDSAGKSCGHDYICRCYVEQARTLLK